MNKDGLVLVSNARELDEEVYYPVECQRYPSNYAVYAIVQMRKKGFAPLLYGWNMFEHTFVFQTTREAEKASQLFEWPEDRDDVLIQAWWYGLDDEWVCDLGELVDITNYTMPWWSQKWIELKTLISDISFKHRVNLMQWEDDLGLYDPPDEFT